MASNIDATKPITGTPTTQSVRDNFSAAKTEIESLQTGKQDTLVSGTTIKTINGSSILGSGDIAVAAGATTKVAKFSVGGVLASGLTLGKLRWYPEESITITSVFFSLGAAGSIAVNLSLNDSGNMLSSNIVTGASDYKSNTGVPTSPNITTSDYVTVNITNFGATAAHITVHIIYTKT